jgi:hypothetical protein
VLGIWGREFLAIELCKHHVGMLDLSSTCGSQGRRLRHAQPHGAAASGTHAERDALDQYAAGKHCRRRRRGRGRADVGGDLLLDPQRRGAAHPLTKRLDGRSRQHPVVLDGQSREAYTQA